MSNKIEESGVSILQMKLDKYTFLKSKFFSGEKTMSIDGWLYVGKNNVNKVTDIENQIFVQIKSHSLLNKSVEVKNRISVNRDDLEYFLITNGCMYFEIFVGENPFMEHTIMYYSFTPLKTKKLIKKMKDESQSSITVTFKEFPEDKSDIEFIIKDFIMKSDNEKGFIKVDLPKMDDLKWEERHEIVFPFIGKKPSDIFEYQEKSELQAYLTIPGTEIKFPIDYNVEFENISTVTDVNICIGDKTYYNQINRVYQKNGEKIIEFGEAFKITLVKNCLNLKYNQPKYFLDELSARQFLMELVKNKYFKINGERIEFGDEINSLLDFEYNLNLIENYYMIKQFLEVSKISKPFIIRNIPQVEFSQLMDITHAYLRDDEFSFDKERICNVKKFKISNLVIAMLVTENNNKEYIRKLTSNKYHVFSKDENGNTDRNTIYSLFKALDWHEIDNIDFDHVYNDLLTPEIPGYLINQIVLEIIVAFDQNPFTTKSSKLIKLAYDILKYLVEKDEGKEIIYLINLFQVKIRIKDFIEEDKEKVYECLSCEKFDNSIKFALYVLIGSKTMSDKYFKQLPRVEQDAIAKYPIFNLYKNL